MKIIGKILAILMIIVMVPVVIAGILLSVVSIEAQPDNLATLTSDIIADTLSKDNLKKITVADVQQYLPYDINAKLTPEMTMEDALPVVFNSVAGIESYISLETLEQMIDDDVIRDVVMAVMHEEEYDFVALVDKYEIPLEPEYRAALAELKTSTVKGELNGQGYDVDEVIEGQLMEDFAPVATGGNSSSQSSFEQMMEPFRPGIVMPILAAIVLAFYLLISLVLWNIKRGLCYWGVGIALAGLVLMILNIFKFDLINLWLNMTNVKMSLTVLEPAINRAMRPILLAGLISMVLGVAVVVGGRFWLQSGAKAEAKVDTDAPKEKKPKSAKPKAKKVNF